MARTNLTALAGTGAARSRNRAAEERARTEALIAEDAEQREAFATAGLPPDWLGTAAAGASAGWIFGPVGGVIGAAVTHILQKRRRESIATQATANAETATTLIEGGQKTLDRLRQAAETDQDHLEVDLLQRQYEDAVTLASNPDPRVAVQGFGALLNIPGLASGEADEIEAAALAREQQERDQLKRWQDQTVDLRNRNEAESRPFVEQSRAFRQFEQLMADGLSNADRTLAANLVARIVNPGEIITEGDVAVIAGGGAVDAAVANRFNEWVLGRSQMDEQTALDMFESMKRLVQVGYEDQVNRNKDFIDLGTELGLPQRFLDNIAIRNPIDPASLERRTLPALDDSANAPVPTGSQASQDLRDLSETVFEYFGLEPGAEVIRHGGRDYSLVDHGDGRREWVPVPSFLDELRERNEERMLLNPGLFQPGGVFGDEMTPEQQRRRQELLDRRREGFNQ